MSINSEAVMTVAFFASAASVCWSAAFAWAKWLQYKRDPARNVPDVEQRLERIERAIDTVAVEVERLGEGQRFTVRLLSEGSRKSDEPAERYRVNTPR